MNLQLICKEQELKKVSARLHECAKKNQELLEQRPLGKEFWNIHEEMEVLRKELWKLNEEIGFLKTKIN